MLQKDLQNFTNLEHRFLYIVKEGEVGESNTCGKFVLLIGIILEAFCQHKLI